MADQRPFREIIIDHVRDRRRELVDHPDALELADYDDHLLEVDRADAVEEHLTYCPDCRAKLAIIQTPPAIADERPRSHMKPAHPNRAWMTHLAWAAVVVLVLGATWGIERTASDRGFSVYPVPLSPETTRGELRIEVPASFDRVMLELDASVSGDDGPFLVEVVSETGTYRIPTAPGRGGRFAVSLPVTALGSDAVTIRLLAGDGDARVAVATYHARVIAD